MKWQNNKTKLIDYSKIIKTELTKCTKTFHKPQHILLFSNIKFDLISLTKFWQMPPPLKMNYVNVLNQLCEQHLVLPLAEYENVLSTTSHKAVLRLNFKGEDNRDMCTLTF